MRCCLSFAPSCRARWSWSTTRKIRSSIGFCSDERASNAINSIAVYRNWINLYFFEGDTLPDPERLLQGSGSTVRHIRITAATDLDALAVRALIAEARKRADPPLAPRAKGRVILKQVRKF